MKNRPYVFLCTGMSLDGKIASPDKNQIEIATADDREMLYEGRIRADAVMIGGNSIKLDESKLTVKTEERQKIRLKNGKTKEPYTITVMSDIKYLDVNNDFLNSTAVKRIIFTTDKSLDKDIKKIEKYAEVYKCGSDRVCLETVLEILHNMGIKTLMVEGGGELIASFLEQNLVDEINLKIGNKIIGGRDTVTFCDGKGFTGDNTKEVEIANVIVKSNYIILKAYLKKQYL